MDTPITGVCLDLNIWVADFLARRAHRRGTAARALVDMVRDGACGLGPVQLVISWGMLERLHLVLMRTFAVAPDAAQDAINAIATVARKGPRGTPPYVLLGGTGVIALRDTEDRGVLETAFAGRAGVLVTHNFKDFLGNDARVVRAGSVAIVHQGARRVIVATPGVMLEWAASGRIDADIEFHGQDT